MSAMKWLFTAILLVATPIVSHSRIITAKMHEISGSGSSARTRGIPAVYTNLRTVANDTIVAIQRTSKYRGVLEFRGDSTYLAPGTTILTNALVCFYDQPLVGDPDDEDRRPVRIIASGLRTDSSSEGGTIDRNAGIKVYGYLRAHRLEVTGFTNPPYGEFSQESGGDAIIVEHGGLLDLYDSRTYGNLGGLRVPSWANAPTGSRISVAQTWRCVFDDSLQSLYVNPNNRAAYNDHYSRFTKGVLVGGAFHSPVGPDSLAMLRANFVGSRFENLVEVTADSSTVTMIKSADFDDNGRVAFVDFFMFASNFGKPAAIGTAEAAFDLNGDGAVNFNDFFEFVGQWNSVTKTMTGLAKPAAILATPEQVEMVRLFLRQHPEFVPLLPPDLKAMLGAGTVLPKQFALDQNFPNPFNASTTIAYTLPGEENVQLIIYGLTGQEVRTLVSSRQAAGRYQVRWDSADNSGRLVGSGHYFYRLQAGAYGGTRRLLVLK